MTSKTQIWTIELEIPKALLQWKSEEIREIIEKFIDDIERLSISNYDVFGSVKPRIKVKQYLKRG